MTEFFATPDETGDLHASELHSSMGEQLGAEASDAFMGGTRMLMRGSQYLGAKYGVDPSAAMGAADAGIAGMQVYDKAMDDLNAQPDVPIADVQARVKQAGLEPFVKLPDQPTMRGPVLDMMLDDANDRAQYAAAVNRGPQGFLPDALGLVTQIGAGMIDPVNAAAFSIPVLGEARYGKILASAGDSILGRAAVRTGVGAAQGAVGGAALVPPDWWLHSQDGQDYTMADALKSVVMSAGMGAAAHGGFGAAGDLYSRIKGEPLEGAPTIAGTHLPEEALAPGGATDVDLDGVPGITAPQNNAPAAISEARHPAEVLADLPQRAQEDVVRSSIADVINGEPVRAGELLQEAAKEDPRVAESVPGIDVYHGSPHDFDQFDSGKVGTGEGAQSYGHGLYFAENETVAADYADRLSRDEYELPPEAQAKYGERLTAAKTDYENAFDALATSQVGGAEPQAELQMRLGDAARAWEAVLEDARGEFPSSRIYKVHINADPEHFLDYDKPLSEQSEHVKTAIAGIGDKVKVGWLPTHANEMAQLRKEMLAESRNGAELYSRLGRGIAGDKGIDAGQHQVAASSALRDAGIPGIKYLDQGSRASDAVRLEGSIADVQKQIADVEAHVDLNRNNPSMLPAFFERQASEVADLRSTLERYRTRLAELAKPTRNYVVFDDKLIRITHKNGAEVGLDEMKAAQAGEPQLPGAPKRPAKAKGPQSLLQFLAARGGISDKDPLVDDLLQSFGGKNPTVQGHGKLIRDGGKPLDNAREAAVEAGYIHDEAERHGGVTESSINDLLDAVDREANGEKQYPAGNEGFRSKDELAAEAEQNTAAREQHVAGVNADLDRLMNEWGVAPQLQKFVKRRAFDIADNENVDTETALERSVSEFSSEGQNVIGDRGRADWQSLSRRQDPDGADMADASREADKAPEPPETPAKSVSAAESEAAKADKLLADMLPSLSEDERRVFEEALTDLENDKSAREQMVRDGAACLAEASLESAA